jgi:hypothetical protein
MWPNDANTVCNEHNDALAKALFPQTVDNNRPGA